MATTTVGAIRDRLIEVIKGLPPTSDSQLAFRPHLDELDANFRRFARQNPSGMTRMFQVMDDGSTRRPAVTNLDVEEHTIVFEIVVAYATDHRFGEDAARARRDAIRQDELAITRAAGIGGRENFTPPTYPDAYWVDSKTIREYRDVDAVEFLVITQTMRFLLDVS